MGGGLNGEPAWGGTVASLEDDVLPIHALCCLGYANWLLETIQKAYWQCPPFPGHWMDEVAKMPMMAHPGSFVTVFGV